MNDHCRLSIIFDVNNGFFICQIQCADTEKKVNEINSKSPIFCNFLVFYINNDCKHVNLKLNKVCIRIVFWASNDMWNLSCWNEWKKIIVPFIDGKRERRRKKQTPRHKTSSKRFKGYRNTCIYSQFRLFYFSVQCVVFAAFFLLLLKLLFVTCTIDLFVLFCFSFLLFLFASFILVHYFLFFFSLCQPYTQCTISK